MKIESSLQTILKDISLWLDNEKWRFSSVFAIDLKDSLQIKWVFAPIGLKEELMEFTAIAQYNEQIPSINSIVPSAWIAEWELHEMMGVSVENAKHGLFLEPDMLKAPLRKDAK